MSVPPSRSSVVQCTKRPTPCASSAFLHLDSRYSAVPPRTLFPRQYKINRSSRSVDDQWEDELSVAAQMQHQPTTTFLKVLHPTPPPAISDVVMFDDCQYPLCLREHNNTTWTAADVDQSGVSNTAERSHFHHRIISTEENEERRSQFATVNVHRASVHPLLQPYSTIGPSRSRNGTPSPIESNRRCTISCVRRGMPESCNTRTTTLPTQHTITAQQQKSCRVANLIRLYSTTNQSLSLLKENRTENVSFSRPKLFSMKQIHLPERSSMFGAPSVSSQKSYTVKREGTPCGCVKRNEFIIRRRVPQMEVAPTIRERMRDYPLTMAKILERKRQISVRRPQSVCAKPKVVCPTQTSNSSSSNQIHHPILPTNVPQSKSKVESCPLVSAPLTSASCSIIPRSHSPPLVRASPSPTPLCPCLQKPSSIPRSSPPIPHIPSPRKTIIIPPLDFSRLHRPTNHFAHQQSNQTRSLSQALSPPNLCRTGPSKLSVHTVPSPTPLDELRTFFGFDVAANVVGIPGQLSSYASVHSTDEYPTTCSTASVTAQSPMGSPSGSPSRSEKTKQRNSIGKKFINIVSEKMSIKKKAGTSPSSHVT